MSALAEQGWAANAVSSKVRQFYAEIGVELPQGTGQVMVRCFANPGAHRHDDRVKSCSVNLLTGQWLCHGCGAKGNAYYAALERAWSRQEAAELAKKYTLFVGDDDDRVDPQKFTMGGARQWVQWMNELERHPKLIRRLGAVKGWTRAAIQRCALGWDGERVTFVNRRLVGSKWKITGVVRYLPGGKPKMVALPGSERTLFPPPEFMVKRWPLFVVEGEPDAVAVVSAGFQGVAVPGAARWRPEWAQRLSLFERVIVLCDCDDPGRRLAAQVRATLGRARVVDLDSRRDDGYDVGDLLLEATREFGVDAGARQVGRILANLVEVA